VLLLIAVLALLLTVSVGITGASTSPVSHWPAEGDAADVVGTNNGTLFPVNLPFAAGQVGQAFDLTGNNDHIEIPDSPSFDFTDLTISEVDPEIRTGG